MHIIYPAKCPRTLILLSKLRTVAWKFRLVLTLKVSHRIPCKSREIPPFLQCLEMYSINRSQKKTWNEGDVFEVWSVRPKTDSWRFPRRLPLPRMQTPCCYRFSLSDRILEKILHNVSGQWVKQPRDLYTILQYLRFGVCSIDRREKPLRRRFTSNRIEEKTYIWLKDRISPNLATRGLICIRVLAISNGEHANAPSVPPNPPAVACIRSSIVSKHKNTKIRKMKPKKNYDTIILL